MERNPYAPPASTDAPPVESGLVFSPEGADVVLGLSKWMRVLSFVFFVGIALLVIGALSVAAFAGNVGVLAGALIGIGVGVAILIGGAMFLREAADGFERGILSADEGAIGQGFRGLRSYLVLFGVLEILTAIRTILGVLG